MAIVGTMAIMRVPTGTIELIVGVLVTPVILALLAQSVGETRGAVGAVQQQTNGTQSTMVQALSDQGTALTALVHHLATLQAASPALPVAEQAALAHTNPA